MRNNYLLDADETILDFVRASKESLAEAMRELNIPYRDSDYAVYKRFNDAVWREYGRGTLSKKALMTERFVRFFDYLKVVADVGRANEIYFGRICRSGYLLDGAMEFLLELKKRGKIFLITNGTPAAQYGRLDSLGLRDFFDGIYVSDDIGFAKPDRRVFEYVLGDAGLKREECLVIGDSVSSDIAGANNANILCIRYNPKKLPAEGAKADFEADSYEKILAIADRLNSEAV